MSLLYKEGFVISNLFITRFHCTGLIKLRKKNCGLMLSYKYFITELHVMHKRKYNYHHHELVLLLLYFHLSVYKFTKDFVLLWGAKIILITSLKLATAYMYSVCIKLQLWNVLHRKHSHKYTGWPKKNSTADTSYSATSFTKCYYFGG